MPVCLFLRMRGKEREMGLLDVEACGIFERFAGILNIFLALGLY